MGFFDFLFKSKSKPSPKQEVKSYVLREGQSIEADAVFAAWTSGDLEEMLSAIEVKTNHVDRHFLLQSIVDNTYKLRKDGEKRKICKKIAEVHIAEFPLIASALEKDMNMLPRVSTFQHYAILLTEDGELSKAVDVCKMALKYGLHDGTKTGFEGRISRIEKKAKANQ